MQTETIKCITESQSICTVEKIHEYDTLKMINKMDGTTMVVHVMTIQFKSYKIKISKPLTLIMNQMLESGIFPDSLKIAKIIPLYKKVNTIP